ncbi:MAG: cyclic lactone autoinducer peptide [Syntrophomonadaceae bacterium]|nr:cyclic lactone autoinducer peptide [Syntrophomonadaceae bacterium]
MFKKLKVKALTNLALAFAFVAGIGIGPNSAFIMYEPDIPESLKNRN